MDLRFVDEAVRSPKFWAYLGMVGIVSDLIDHLFHYISGCSCHASAKVFKEWAHQHAPEMANLACPCSGMLLPQVSCGELRKKLNQLWAVSEASIMMRCNEVSEARGEQWAS